MACAGPADHQRRLLGAERRGGGGGHGSREQLLPEQNRHKKPQSQHHLYQACGFLYLSQHRTVSLSRADPADIPLDVRPNTAPPPPLSLSPAVPLLSPFPAVLQSGFLLAAVRTALTRAYAACPRQSNPTALTLALSSSCGINGRLTVGFLFGWSQAGWYWTRPTRR
eukprot:957660-Rhodomonas_salina.1